MRKIEKQKMYTIHLLQKLEKDLKEVKKLLATINAKLKEPDGGTNGGDNN